MKSALRYGLSLGLMAAFLYWAFRGVDPEALWAAGRQASPAWLVLLVATTAFTLVVRAWRWVVLLRGAEPAVRVRDAALALAICYSANIAVPRSGEALRALSLKWARGASLGAVLGTVVVERILDMVGLLLMIGLSLALLPGRLAQAYPWIGGASLATLAACAVLAGLLAAVSARGDRGVDAAAAVVGRLWAPAARAVAGLLGRFVHGLSSLRSPSAYAEILLSSLLLNAGYILIIYESFRAFDGPFRAAAAPVELGAAAALVITAISSIGVVIPTPGGTGSYHFFFGNSLQVLFGVPAGPAMACATVVHALANLTYVVLGVPALIHQRLRLAAPSATPPPARQHHPSGPGGVIPQRGAGHAHPAERADGAG